MAKEPPKPRELCNKPVPGSKVGSLCVRLKNHSGKCM
jgi:hypothetical protein